MATLNQVYKEASAKKLYKDLLAMARYLGQRQGNEAALVGEVRQQFRINMHEEDEAKVVQLKEAAIRALSNCYFQEAERLARSKKR